MNDLLQRLRDREAHTHNMQYQETYPTIKLCEEAADEIERLRAALEQARAATYGLKNDLYKLHDVGFICEQALAREARRINK